jgi:glc operon protein GlcG
MNPINTLGHLEAQKAIEAIQTEMLKQGKAAVVSVADTHGDLIALLRVDGARLTSIQIAINKAYTAARERRPSGEIGDTPYFGDPRIVGWGGGLPVIVDGVVVGAVGVSGLPSAEDIELAQIGIDAILALLKESN